MNVFGDWDCKFRNNLETCGAGKSFEASPQAGRHTASPGSYQPLYLYTLLQTSQELRMLSSVTINCQVTKIVMEPGSQLSVL